MKTQQGNNPAVVGGTSNNDNTSLQMEKGSSNFDKQADGDTEAPQQEESWQEPTSSSCTQARVIQVVASVVCFIFAFVLVSFLTKDLDLAQQEED